MDIIKAELDEVKTKFAVPRQSEFPFGGMDMIEEDPIKREDMLVTVTHGGYVNRTPLSTYRTQHRRGTANFVLTSSSSALMISITRARLRRISR